MLVRRLVPHSSGDFRDLIDLEGRTADRVDLIDLGLESAVVVDRVPSMAVQARDLVHVLLVAEFIRAHVIYRQELVSDAVRLGILLEHVLIQVISRHTLRVLHPQLLSHPSSRSSILSKVVHNLGASRAMDQEVDRVVGDLYIHLFLSRLAVVRPGCSP